ncbi:hypothetical protein BDF20DRAFT_896993 [Mycotypha africana]|uniref:uncharacterized protein n=1 Tax=Mycotypha africana TaxID=64632 RepID=UPI002301309F|nr:uncharacterized protein BDF20DRAFT_896993 [Mycotypha africana]KAI8968550.1 hypothetical protein BDF20DRAFT_896993 [Mycotypha africana]
MLGYLRQIFAIPHKLNMKLSKNTFFSSSTIFLFRNLCAVMDRNVTETRWADTNKAITIKSDVNGKLEKAIKKLETLESIHITKQLTSHYSYGIPTEESTVIKDRLELKLKLRNEHNIYCQVIFDSHNYMFPPDIIFKKETLPSLRSGKQHNNNGISHLLPLVSEWNLNDEKCLYSWIERIVSFFEKYAIIENQKKIASDFRDDWLSSTVREPTATDNIRTTTTSATEDILDKVQRSKNRLFKQKVLKMSRPLDKGSMDDNNDDFDSRGDRVIFPRRTVSLAKDKAAACLKRSNEQSPSLCNISNKDWLKSYKDADKEIVEDNDSEVKLSDYRSNAKRPYEDHQQLYQEVNHFVTTDFNQPTKKLRKSAVSVTEKDVSNRPDDWMKNAHWREGFMSVWLQKYEDAIMLYDASSFRSFTMFLTFAIKDESIWDNYVALKKPSIEEFRRNNNMTPNAKILAEKRSAPVLIQFNMDSDVPHSKLNIRLISALNTAKPGSAEPDYVDLEYNVDPAKTYSGLVTHIMSFLTERVCYFHLFQQKKVLPLLR